MVERKALLSIIGRTASGVALLALAACSQADPSPVVGHGGKYKRAVNIEARGLDVSQSSLERTFNMPAADVAEHLRAGLAELGLTITEDDAAGMVAKSERLQVDSWAACPTVWNRDRSNDSRSRRAQSINRSVLAVVDLRQAAGGTTVAIDARFSELQRNTLANHTFTVLCDTTGTFESTLLDLVESRGG